MTAGLPVRGGVRAAPSVLLGIVLSVTAVATARAHTRSMSYSTWDIRGRQAHVTVRLSELDMSAVIASVAVAPELTVGAYLTERLRLVAGDAACVAVGEPRPRDSMEGRAVYEWRLNCPRAGPLRIESTLLLDVIPSHLHFARVSMDGAPVGERALSDGARVWPLTGAPGMSVAESTALGVRHFWTGYDHVAFLLALLLIGGSRTEIAKVVFGFTVAHSMTLALGALGYVRPERAPIEALIGLTIALVALENVWLAGGRSRALPWLAAVILAALAILAGDGHGRVPALTLAGLAMFTVCYFELIERRQRRALVRWPIAFVFGLVHGFGFASALVDGNLSMAPRVRALCGFNLGLEIGQLGVVLLLWMVLRRAIRSDDDAFRWKIVEMGSAAVFGLGVFWFVARAYG